MKSRACEVSLDETYGATGSEPRLPTIVAATGEILEVHPEGVYFGMSEAEYRPDPSLGSTNIKQLAVSGSDFFWDSPMNPLKDELPEEAESRSRALVGGSAWHSIVLDGLESFEANYTHLPHKGSVEGLLDTNEHMEGWLRRRAVYFPSKARKADLIALINKTAADAGETPPPIWELIKQAAEASGKTILTFREYARLMMAGRLVTAHPDMGPCFTQGYPEVAIFWRELIEDIGVWVPCKAKLDYLKLILTADLKSMGNSGGRNLEATAIRAISTYGYDLQHAHYQTAREMARRFVREGKVFDLTQGRRIKEWVPEAGSGEKKLVDRSAMPSRKWLQAFEQKATWDWVWVMTKKEGAPLSIPIRFNRIVPWRQSAALADRERALRKWATFMTKFGPDQLWIDFESMLDLSENDLPSYLRA